MLQVSKVHCRTLIDSGACRSLLGYDTWVDLRTKTGRTLKLERIPDGINLRSLSQNVIPTLGLATVNVYGQNVEFFVVKSMSHDMLLGDDANRVLKAKICYEKNEVRLMGRRHVSGKAGSDDIDVSSVQLDLDKWAQEFFYFIW